MWVRRNPSSLLVKLSQLLQKSVYLCLRKLKLELVGIPRHAKSSYRHLNIHAALLKQIRNGISLDICQQIN